MYLCSCVVTKIIKCCYDFFALTVLDFLRGVHGVSNLLKRLGMLGEPAMITAMLTQSELYNIPSYQDLLLATEGVVNFRYMAPTVTDLP